jgi:hypothetical protein
MTSREFPSQAQIVRVVKAAERAGIDVSAVRVEPTGAILIFAHGAPPLALVAPPGEDEPNDFD